MVADAVLTCTLSCLPRWKQAVWGPGVPGVPGLPQVQPPTTRKIPKDRKPLLQSGTCGILLHGVILTLSLTYNFFFLSQYPHFNMIMMHITGWRLTNHLRLLVNDIVLKFMATNLYFPFMWTNNTVKLRINVTQGVDCENLSLWCYSNTNDYKFAYNKNQSQHHHRYFIPTSSAHNQIGRSIKNIKF